MKIFLEDYRLIEPTLVINAGGKSRRMGRSKALLPMPPDERSLISHIAHCLRPLTNGPILVVANDPVLIEKSQIPGAVDFIPDRYPGAGTLGGIATALHSSEGWVMMVACDMPFVNPSLFEMLCGLASKQDAIEGREQWDAVVPHVGGYAQTMHALYHRRCLPIIEARLAKGQLKAGAFLGGVRTNIVSEEAICPVDPTLRSFTNVNTPEEWQAALALLAA